MNLFQYTYDLVRQIPPGKISSYGAVAQALGDSIASRAVGYMMNQNPDANTMPCYKIVHSDGRLGGFGLGIEDKIRRLRTDGISVEDGKIVDFQHVFFNDFKSVYPLKKLRDEQEKLSAQVITDDDQSGFRYVAGVDVAYPKNAFENASASCVVLDSKTRQIVEEKNLQLPVFFPYIPTYFSYREYPLIEQLIKSLETVPSVLMVDGNGILHPRRFGLASHVGVHLHIPTIGVAKSLLGGLVKKNNVIMHNEIRGSVLYHSNSKHPLFVSPGHRISLKTSKQISKELCVTRIPEPLRRAHVHAKKNVTVETVIPYLK